MAKWIVWSIVGLLVIVGLVMHQQTSAYATLVESEAVAYNPTAEALVKARMQAAQATSRYGLLVENATDQGFNQLAIAGLERAQAELGLEIEIVEVQDADYATAVNDLIASGVDGVVTVGLPMALATRDASIANPNIPFISVDFPSQTNGDIGLLFSTDEPAFMAGYLAAGMTTSGTVCTFGGIQIPPVLSFMVGFENGITYYNAEQGTAVTLLGWATNPTLAIGGNGAFIGNFTDQDAARALAEDFFSQGCDIIFPVAGGASLGADAAALEQGLLSIGVDADQRVTAPEYASVYLTSVLKRVDIAVFEAIREIELGELPTVDNFQTNYIGTLNNGGVGLATYSAQVPPELQAEIAAIQQQFIAGTLFSGWPIGVTPVTEPAPAPDPEPQPEPEPEPEPESEPESEEIQEPGQETEEEELETEGVAEPE